MYLHQLQNYLIDCYVWDGESFPVIQFVLSSVKVRLWSLESTHAVSPWLCCSVKRVLMPLCELRRPTLLKMVPCQSSTDGQHFSMTDIFPTFPMMNKLIDPLCFWLLIDIYLLSKIDSALSYSIIKISSGRWSFSYKFSQCTSAWFNAFLHQSVIKASDLVSKCSGRNPNLV